MNFEKVEIFGFKSFADKAEIKFGNGITGIVGPNGCGKSNVADSIRWVLGEQSAKTLRGSSMQDVIFAGTQNRKSLSYCEVSLYFDNSNKMFSLDYNEVIITRKLYRSGESEYFINKQPARLKDIVDLLHECGIGKEGYTIIGQGKVEEIMSAKPEDRRMIFEEATGIAKFKTRKNESERKLERTHENIVRYVDILTEIENQLGPLERQAEKAREFNELSAELKHHELNTYIAKVEGVASAKGKINMRIEGINEQTALRQSEMAETQREYDKIFSDIEDADVRLKKYNEELMEKRVGMEKSTGAKQLFDQKISYLLSQIERAEGEIKNNLALIEECKGSLSSNSAKIREDETALNKLCEKADSLSRKLMSLGEKIAIGEELAQTNRKKIIESIESLSDFKLNKGTLSAEKENLENKLAELNERLSNLTFKREGQFTEKERVDKSIDELDRSVFDFKNRIAEKEDEVRDGNENVAAVDNKIYTLNSVITSLVTKDNFYRSMKDSYEGYAPAVKLLMSKAKNNPELSGRIKGVVAELIKSDKKYDVALETALAAAAQNVVTSNPDDARYLIEYLKVNKFGRVTFLPITSVKPRMQSAEVTRALSERGAMGVANELVSYDRQFENVISNLLGNTLIVDTLEHATDIAKKYRFTFKIVTLDGDVFSTQGAMTGGSRRTDAPGLLSSDRRIEDNAAELERRRTEMNALKTEKAELEKKRDKALEELTFCNDVYNGKRQQLLVEREKQSAIERTLSETGREIEAVSDAVYAVNERLSKLNADFENIASGGKKLEQDKEIAANAANKQEAEYDALKRERDELAKESTETQIKITELRAEISALNADNARFAGTVKESEESVAGLEKSNENARKIIEELKIEQEKVALTKEEQDSINRIRQSIEKIERLKGELREKLERNAEEKERLAQAVSELSERKHAEEIALAKIDSDLEYMGQSILEDYQETYDTALKYREEGYDAQKDAIEKIKGEMLTQFDEGFTKINENFQRIFKELFGGGRAMLELDYSEAEDRLEAGVEIIAEPPGKKLQKLSLLSGGEKALTAIAILFSILKLRPMPFCVLDEIEAALDEANVDRFARYLQKFSQDTQFIVITHRKPTMEMADALFGVTMQEKGVSKMVSVKLSDVADIEAENLA